MMMLENYGSGLWLKRVMDTRSGIVNHWNSIMVNWSNWGNCLNNCLNNWSDDNNFYKRFRVHNGVETINGIRSVLNTAFVTISVNENHHSVCHQRHRSICIKDRFHNNFLSYRHRCRVNSYGWYCIFSDFYLYSYLLFFRLVHFQLGLYIHKVV